MLGLIFWGNAESPSKISWEVTHRPIHSCSHTRVWPARQRRTCVGEGAAFGPLGITEERAWGLLT